MRHLLFILLLSTAACDATDPDSPPQTMGVDAGVEDPREEGVPLTLFGVESQTYWETIPLRGTGPQNGMLIVDTPQGQKSVNLGADGSFCLELALAPGLNSFNLIARNEFGEESRTVSADILREGEPPKPGEPLPAKNIALGGQVFDTTFQEQEGTFSSMTDGNLDSSVLAQNAVFLSDWLIMEIPNPDGVEKIRVYHNKQCLIGEYYIQTAPSVLTDMLQPGIEAVDEEPWTYRGHTGAQSVTDCSNSTLSCQEFSFDSVVVGAIGLRVKEDSDCTNAVGGFGLGEHRIHQIEAWTPEGVTPPDYSAPTCASGF